MVHPARDLRQRAVDGVALQFAALRVDEVYLAGVSAPEQRIEVELPHPELGQVGGDADHRDRPRVEHVVQRVGVARVFLWHAYVQSLV